MKWKLKYTEIIGMHVHSLYKIRLLFLNSIAIPQLPR